jgi:hypothetical protein
LPPGQTLCGHALETPIQLSKSFGQAVVAAGDDGSYLTVIESERGLASRYEAGAGWSEPQPIVPQGGTNLGWHLGLGSSGEATALWSELSATTTLRTSRYVGGSWAPPASLGSVHKTISDLKVAPSGQAVAAWQGVALSGQPVVNIATFEPASGWSAPFDMVARSERPRVAIDASGNAAAVWLESDTSNVRIFAARRPVGGSWEIDPTLNPIHHEHSVNALDVASLPGGRFVAVWDNTQTKSAYFSRFEPGTGWTPAELLEKTDSTWSKLRLYIDRKGFGFALWNRLVGTVAVPVAARFNPDTFIFERPVPLGDVVPTAIDVNGGHAVAAWLGDGKLWGSCYVETSGWSHPVAIAGVPDDPRTDEPFGVAMGPSGAAVFVWGTKKQGTCAAHLK